MSAIYDGSPGPQRQPGNFAQMLSCPPGSRVPPRTRGAGSCSSMGPSRDKGGQGKAWAKCPNWTPGGEGRIGLRSSSTPPNQPA